MFKRRWPFFRPECGQDPLTTEAEIALRTGLRELPVPETAPDFADRIHAALETPPSWWETLWQTVRPAFAGAVGAFAVTCGLLALLAQQPVPFTVAPIAKPSNALALERALTPEQLPRLSLADSFCYTHRNRTRF